MNKIYVILPIILLLIGAFFLFKRTQSVPDTVVYYIPHQDDEILTFGVSIYDSVQKGKDVHVVLLTNGAASNVRKKLGLTREEFTAARNREMEKSLRALGVDLQNFSKKNLEDGALTVKQTEEVIKEYIKRFPNAEHNTFSYHDPHPDHRNAGTALDNLMKEGIVEHGKFYIGNNYTPPNTIKIEHDHYDESYFAPIKEASRSYNIENKEMGFYGIGWRSVPEYFQTLESDPKSIYHH